MSRLSLIPGIAWTAAIALGGYAVGRGADPRKVARGIVRAFLEAYPRLRRQNAIERIRRQPFYAPETRGGGS